MRYLAVILAALAFAATATARVLPPAGSGSITVAPGSQLAFQGTVTFVATGTDGLDNPRVWIACYQSGALVYGEGGGPSQTFKLGGDSSQWVLNGGGAADCTVTLYYILDTHGHEWAGHGAQGGTVTLATITFGAAA